MPDARGGIAGAVRKKNDVSRHVRPRRATCFIRANVSKIFPHRTSRILLGNLALQPKIISSRRRHWRMYPAGNVGELVSDLTTSALLIARGVHLRKHGKSPSGLRLRPRDAKE